MRCVPAWVAALAWTSAFAGLPVEVCPYEGHQSCANDVETTCTRFKDGTQSLTKAEKSCTSK